MTRLYISLGLLVSFGFHAQTFEEITPTVFKDFYYSAAAIGDYDNDGYQDVFFTGAIDEGSLTTYNEFYKNNNGIFAVQQQFTENAVHFNNGNVKFIDFDNDGLLDIVTSGLSYNDIVNYQQYRFKNNGTTFELVENLSGKIYGGIEVFDFNHDGKQDYALNGIQYETDGFTYKLDLYTNSESGFIKTDEWLPGSQSGDFKVADFNNDNLLDVMIYGYNSDYEPFSAVYINNGGNLVASQELTALGAGKMAYADFNADGFLDAVVSGQDENYESVIRVLMNDGTGTFTETALTEGLISDSFIETGDLNNDGYYDFVIIGNDDDYNGYVNVFLYNPADSTFSLAENTNLYGLGSGGTVKLFDYNNDHHLDVLMNGFDWNDPDYAAFTKLFKNTSTDINEKPEAPQTLSAEVQEGKVVFSWFGAEDDKTPENALQYELSVGTEAGKADIAKYVVTTKNWFLNTENLPDEIFWSVKSIDASKVLSESSEEQTLSVLSVSENSAADIRFYPNPVKDILHISTKEKVQKIQVFSVSGQLVKTQSGDHKSIDLSILPKGIYVVKVSFSNGKTEGKKVIRP